MRGSLSLSLSLCGACMCLCWVTQISSTIAIVDKIGADAQPEEGHQGSDVLAQAVARSAADKEQGA
jgi:hypothetical protein